MSDEIVETNQGGLSPVHVPDRRMHSVHFAQQIHSFVGVREQPGNDFTRPGSTGCLAIPVSRRLNITMILILWLLVPVLWLLVWLIDAAAPTTPAARFATLRTLIAFGAICGVLIVGVGGIALGLLAFVLGLVA
jgi:hypothetical protein